MVASHVEALAVVAPDDLCKIPCSSFRPEARAASSLVNVKSPTLCISERVSRPEIPWPEFEELEWQTRDRDRMEGVVWNCEGPLSCPIARTSTLMEVPRNSEASMDLLWHSIKYSFNNLYQLAKLPAIKSVVWPPRIPQEQAICQICRVQQKRNDCRRSVCTKGHPCTHCTQKAT